MHRLTITHQGRILLDDRILTGDPFHLLGEAVMLDAGFTLGSWFSLIQWHPELQRLSRFLPGLVSDIAAHAAEEGEHPEVRRLEMVRTVELVGHPPPPRLDIYVSIFGFFDAHETPIKHIPPQQLLGTPLALGQCRHMVLGDRLSHFSVATTFTLFEFIEAVAWQLSFHGAATECTLRR